MRKNILLVILDGCRADRLGCYGYTSRETTPYIDGLAERSLVGLRHYSTSFCTFPAVISMMTGLYPCLHGASGTWNYYDGRHPFLTDILRSEGYETFGIANNIVAISPEFGFIRGYSRFYRVGRERNWFKESKEESRKVRSVPWPVRARRTLGRWYRRVAPGPANRRICAHHLRFYATRDMGGRKAAAAFGRMLGERDATRPFFCFLNIPETHHPFIPLESHRSLWGPLEMTENLVMLNMNPSQFEEEGRELTEREFHTLQMMYDARLRHTDDLVRQVCGSLADAGLLEDTVIVMTGDHGGMLWEKNRLFGSTCFTYEPEITVPLIVHGAGSGERTGGLTSAVDLFPTLLTAAEVPGARRPGLCHGVDLLSSGDRHDSVVADYPEYPFWLKKAVMAHPSILAKYGRTNRTLVTADGRKLIWVNSGCHEQYDLARDPGEQTNLFGRDASGFALIERMRELYVSLVGPEGACLERYPNLDIGENMTALPPLAEVNPDFDPSSVVHTG